MDRWIDACVVVCCVLCAVCVVELSTFFRLRRRQVDKVKEPITGEEEEEVVWLGAAVDQQSFHF